MENAKSELEQICKELQAWCQRHGRGFVTANVINGRVSASTDPDGRVDYIEVWLPEEVGR